MSQITFSTTSKIEDFFDGSTDDRTLTAIRVVELLESYVESRSREEGKRGDLKIYREMMKNEETAKLLNEAREKLGK